MSLFCTISLYGGGHLGKGRALLPYFRALRRENNEQHSSPNLLRLAVIDCSALHPILDRQAIKQEGIGILLTYQEVHCSIPAGIPDKRYIF